MIKRYKILKPIMLSFSLARDQSDVLHAHGYLDADDETIWLVRHMRLSHGLPHHQQGREETISSVAMLEWWLLDGALEEINMDVGPRTEKQDAQALTVALREANAVITDQAAAVARLKLELATSREWFAEQQKLVVNQRAQINALDHDNTHGAKALGERLEAVMTELDKERGVVAELIRERNLLASDQSDAQHAAHCCVHHSCAYGEDGSCAVLKQRVVQQYPCEDCVDEKEREALRGAEVRDWQRKNVEATPAPDHHNARRLAWRAYAVSSTYTAHPPDRINMADALLTAEEAHFGEVK